MQCVDRPIMVYAGRKRRGLAYVVEGGRPLRGRITLSGAKNAVTKQMVATLLTDQPCLIENVPRSTEVAATLAMLRGLGTQHAWLESDALELHTPRLAASVVDPAQARLNRIPLLTLGPLMHRAGEAWVPLPGGCPIGQRPVDIHLALLSAMGAHMRVEGEGFSARGRLHGSTLRLPYPSVGATESGLLAAVLAPGRTTIAGAALEPEILDTVALLRSMGAQIRIAPPRTIVIDGVHRLGGARHRVLSDRTEAASFAFAAAATGGCVEVAGATPRHLQPLCRVFGALGGRCEAADGSMVFSCGSGLRPLWVESAPYPGLSTDWLPPLVVALTQASGRSMVHETVFENRLGYAQMLARTGARLEVSDRCPAGRTCRFGGQGHAHSCAVQPSRLHGARLTAPDLRGGFAMLLAALVADGQSEIAHMERVERGYADLAAKLVALGARLRVVGLGERRAA